MNCQELEGYESVKRLTSGVQVNHSESQHTSEYHLRWFKRFVDSIGSDQTSQFEASSETIKLSEEKDQTH